MKLFPSCLNRAVLCTYPSKDTCLVSFTLLKIKDQLKEVGSLIGNLKPILNLASFQQQRSKYQVIP